jgi:hypothetical protein
MGQDLKFIYDLAKQACNTYIKLTIYQQDRSHMAQGKAIFKNYKPVKYY